MANRLTGDYDAVLQISLRQINAILATLHQNEADRRSPSFPHSCSARIGETPPWLGPDPSRFAAWAGASAPTHAAAGDPAASRRDALLQKTPPGLSERFLREWDLVSADRSGKIRVHQPQGRADFQISTPIVSVPFGSTSQVLVSASVRAQVYPDPGAISLPAPIHGTVSALYSLKPVRLPDGRTVLRVEMSPGGTDISFQPESGTGLSTADVAEILDHVREVARKHFVPPDVALPADFSLSEFTSIGSGPSEALVLPLALAGSIAPSGSLSSVTSQLLGSSEFAIAVGREYLQRFIDALTNRMKAAVAARHIFLHSKILGTATYTLSLSAMSVAWKAGAIEVSGRVDARTPTFWAPNGFISFTQSFELALDPASQAVSMRPLGDPAVDESWFISHDTAVNNVLIARGAALGNASDAFTNALADARQKLAAALASFDASTSVAYTGLEVTPDGIIARGTIGTRFRYDPIVHYEAIDDGAAFNAVWSWIPGGRIDTFEWTWVEQAHPLGWTNRTRRVLIEHEFECPKPKEVTSIAGICLQIHGTRLDVNGHVESVTAGTVCTSGSHEPFLVLPSWWMNLFIPEWLPHPPDDAVLAERIASHVNAAAGPRPADAVTANTIVHFTGQDIERPLERLSLALTRTERRDIVPRVVLVLPEGAFNARRRELEQRLGDVPDAFRGQLLVTDDLQHAWSRAFAANALPATHIINGRGEFVWKGEGALDPDAIARALDEFAIPAPPPQRVPLRLNVRAGLPALDATFTDVRGNQLPLRRLLGRRVLLVFWQSWSAPCVSELRRLQGAGADPESPFVVAINGGETPDVVAETGRHYELGFTLVQDPGRDIATLYGVRCWPTTVSINQGGIVDRIQFGLTHEGIEDGDI